MKKFIVKDVWQVMGSNEHNPRSSHLVGYFVNRWDADLAAEGVGEWGSKGSVQEINLKIQVYESFEEYEKTAVDNEREAALGKLTEKERKLLGLK